MPAPEVIHQLVAKFAENREAYRSGKYNEARLRQDFLDKFFIALGWDVGNDKGFAPEYAEVEIEASLDIEGTSKSPDYAFKIGRERKFFVEAKKPAVDIQYDIHPAYQLRRYAWNAGMPLSILTDFEEFAVYNCKERPNHTDSAATARDKFYRYTEYIEKWDEIAEIFSREAVWKGALERFAETSKGKKGTTAVDDEFLKDMNEWRLKLARNIALRNGHVSDEQQLNYAVQMTIDRVIFLRICEDRGIEPEEQLKNLTTEPGLYPRLLELFRHADLKYNSGLFNFTHDKDDNTPPDTFTPSLSIDDKVLKEFIKDIYYPCPYIFKEIPVEILGQVYEQFLGQVIRLTTGHQAKVEEKPEVRKAGGVYYTPKYIVDYIVANTVGKLLEGKTPAEAAALKIVDPACGSGSFLLGAFQHLIDWHEKWYLDNDPAKWTKGKAPALNEVTNGYRLTTLKKKEILLNNIHGVDIDAQAVEVTKLSLLLKVLEEETGQLSLGLERALPDLGKNIQCGNSLIGEDYFAGQLVVDPAERRRVNPFDWERAFPEVFAQGGFDAVIGNPPYIRIQGMREWAPNEVDFFKKKFLTASKGNYDIYVIFVEQGLNFLNIKGLLGFILPHKFFKTQYGEPLRKLITQKFGITKIIHFGDQQVFGGASTYTCLLFLSKDPCEIISFEKVSDLLEWKNQPENELKEVAFPTINNDPWMFQTEEISRDNTIDLISYSQKIYQGLATSADYIYILKILEESDSEVRLISNTSENKVVILEPDLLRPLIKGAEISRYQDIKHQYKLIFPYSLKDGNAFPIPEKVLKSKYPATYEYLLEHRQLLLKRSKTDPSNWWLYPYPKNLSLFEKPKILSQVLSQRGNFSLDSFGKFYFVGGGNAGGNGISVKNESVSDMKFLLGLLNSQFLTFYVRKVGSSFRGGYFSFSKLSLSNFPIPKISIKDTISNAAKEKIIAFVNVMLDLHKRTATTPQEHEQLRREIESTDRKIDALVYQLYGLPDKEIRIIEENSLL